MVVVELKEGKESSRSCGCGSGENFLFGKKLEPHLEIRPSCNIATPNPMFARQSFRTCWLSLKAASNSRSVFMSAKMNGNYSPAARNDDRKRKYQGAHQFKNKKKGKTVDLKDGSHESVLHMDVVNLLKSLDLDGKRSQVSATDKALPALDEEVTLHIRELSSTGDGLAYDSQSDTVYVVPYTVPEDIVKAKVMRHATGDSVHHILTDLVGVVNPSPQRDDKLINCRYFAKCSGCQFQMVSYDAQLAHKRRIVEKAYQNFSNIDPQKVPTIEDTIGSPLQYGYRTKLTPHFDGPPGKRSDKRRGIVNKFTEVPSIGFMPKHSRKTLDIEDCPIGTEAVRKGMKAERRRVVDELDTFRRGVTILLRESTQRTYKDADEATATKQTPQEDAVSEDHPRYTDYHTCVTDQNAKSKEYVDDFVFLNRAGGFFQNNNSILSRFTDYVRNHVLLKDSAGDNSSKIKYLIDAYCGSGLFTITLSSMFEKSIGIDIDANSIESAAQNARSNNLPESMATFIAADANQLFASVKFPADQSVVIIDPPRKGCDENFLRQLTKYGPARIVYVSCNVHTQARDVGMLVNGTENREGQYEIESLRGFDFFPQTGHVEGVAVLNRKSSVDKEAETAS